MHITSWLEFEASIMHDKPGEFTKAALHTFSSFRKGLPHAKACEPIDILTLTDSDLCGHFDERMRNSSKSCRSTARSRLKRCLMFLTCDASVRWPTFWSSGLGGRLMQSRITKINTFPTEVSSLSEDTPIYTVFIHIYRGIRQHTNRSTVPSLRCALSFLYGFLFADTGSMIPEWKSIESASDIITLLRSKTRHNVCSAYKHYRNQGRCSESLSLGTLQKDLFLINTLFVRVFQAFKEPIVSDVFGIYSRKRKRQTEALTDASTITSCDNSSRFSISALQSYSSMDMSPMLQVNHRQHNDIHCFTEREIRNLYLSCRSLFEKMLLTFLFGTGMRIGGFCRLTVDNQGASLKQGDTLPTVEKGGRHVRYRLSPIMAKLTNEWIATMSPSGYLFPHLRYRNVHIQPGSVRRVFSCIASRAGISGYHVHPHTTRHTVIWTLWALGNPVENISRFVHHSQTSTTLDRYVRPTDADVAENLSMPWVEGSNNKKKVSNKDLAYRLSLAMASPFESDDGKTFPCSLQIRNIATAGDCTSQHSQIERGQSRRERKQHKKRMLLSLLKTTVERFRSDIRETEQ